MTLQGPLRSAFDKGALTNKWNSCGLTDRELNGSVDWTSRQRYECYVHMQGADKAQAVTRLRSYISDSYITSMSFA